MRNFKEMTIFYRLADLELKRVGSGIQDLGMIGNLTQEEASLLYGYFVIPYDDYVFHHLYEFELVENEDKTYTIQMKEAVKNNIRKFL